MTPAPLARSLVVWLTGTLLALLPALPLSAAPPDTATLDRDYDADVRPLLARYCITCHSAAKHKGDLSLEVHPTAAAFRQDAELLEKIGDALDHGEMPPKESPQLSAAGRQALRRWVSAALDAGAAAKAGDPGPVVMRRLTNMEYTNAVRDLTGLDLDPAREFPADAAAGEGFTNVSDALVMSPAMLDKYMDAAKAIAAHAVLLPDGFRFSEKTTRPDWTEEILNRIKDIYRRYTDPRGAEKVQLQGLVWESKGGGQIPLESYLAATIAHRDGGPGRKSLAALAAEQRLSPKYLGMLWDVLHGPPSSLLLAEVQERWSRAKPADVPGLAAMIRVWQGALTNFRSVGHFKPWQVTVNPVEDSHAFRIKLAPAPGASEVVLRLASGDAGDGASGDLVEWQAPRLEAPGRPTILLNDLPGLLKALEAKRQSFKDTARYLALADALRSEHAGADARTLAAGQGLDPEVFAAWLDLLGIAGSGHPVAIESLFTNRIERVGDYAHVKAWGSPQTPSVAANSSDQVAHVPGLMKPHSVAVHPAPTRGVGIGWRSPFGGPARIEVRAVDAHPDCGDGFSWTLERRRNAERRRLRGGAVDSDKAARIDPVEPVALQPGDVICLVIGPRGDYACDLTEVDLTIQELGGERRRWNLSHDVSGNLLASNPHADSMGRRDVWSFFHEGLKAADAGTLPDLPDGSILDRWHDEPSREVRARLAGQLQELLVKDEAAASPADRAFVRGLRGLGGPLLGRIDLRTLQRPGAKASTSLVARAPSVIELRLPADLAAGREFAVTAALDGKEGAEGSAQVQVFVDGKATLDGLVPGLPILAGKGAGTRRRAETAFDDFRRLFPAALCYSQIVPVDEVVTLALYHREDDHLARLMLDDAERKQLDRLWDELEFVSQEALKVEVGYVQFMEYTTQDSDPNLFKHLKKPIAEKAQALRKRLKDTEPRHLDDLEKLARRAYRRPRTPAEQAELKTLYGKLRSQGLEHDAACRLTMARVLIAPAFLYQVELPAPSAEPQPVSPWELASRLSFFLWSSPPDDELLRLAANGTLPEPGVQAAQLRRMLADPRARNLATEFACQWLDIRGFDRHNEKSEQTFPEFPGLRAAMYEEAVLFFVDLFRRNGSLLEVLDTDHTFLNEALARHYGIPGVKGPEWRRVDGIKRQSRGGVLGMAALLAKQSGASRTSPILRGNWLLEMLLGEKLPKPPKNVPQLPESERDTGGLTMRQITEKHRSDASCAKCHVRIDPFGFALEGFDAIGRRRDTDLGGRPIDTRVSLPDGTAFADLPGLRSYLVAQRRDEFVHQFCRKLLGFALGRGVQLSDRPLLETMQQGLAGDDYRLQGVLQAVIQSPQFRLRRGLDAQ